MPDTYLCPPNPFPLLTLLLCLTISLPTQARQSGPVFEDVTERVGIDFVHFNGPTGAFTLPEITGAGAALFDYDNDGDLDLYLVQGTHLTVGDAPDPAYTDRLYRNDLADGRVRFTDVTAESKISAPGYGMGVATGDYNNDGWVDIYVTNLDSNQLFKNNGDGTFQDVTTSSGTDDARWSTSASFFDFDKDGLLDLFVTNYVNFSITFDRTCFARSSARDYCGPDAYDAVSDRLFKNRGDGTFQDVSAQFGLDRALGAGLGVVTADFNLDGWTDIYVANDGDMNRFWINLQGSGFQDQALMAGVAANYMGVPEASMGVDAADLDNDGDLDLFMTHLDQESNTLYENLGNGLFEDRTIKTGLLTPSLQYTSFGTRFFDFDNDGRLDLLIANGAVRVMETLVRRGDTYPLHQKNQLFRNIDNKTFIEITDQAGDAFEVSEVSRGVALGDLDNDGDTDTVIANNNGRARVLLNQIGNRNRWIGLRLMHQDGRRDFVHAMAEVVLNDGTTLWRQVRTDGSYCSAHDPRLVVGLGADHSVQIVRVHWPDGQTDSFPKLSANRYWTLSRSGG